MLKGLIYQAFQHLPEQGMRESNSHQRFWRPLSYHLTNPLYSIKMTYKIRHLLSYIISPQKSIVLLLHCTFKTSYRFEKFKNLFLPFWSSPRSISNSQLHVLPHFHLCPIYLVVFKESYFLMKGISHLEGGFTLRCLQRLSLPDLATLPCRWSTTDTPVVCPSRSSRTKDSSSQISSARAG